MIYISKWKKLKNKFRIYRKIEKNMIIDIIGDIDDYAFERYAKSILEQEIGDEIRIRINSLGGYIDVAQDMAEAIKILAEENNVKIVTENIGDVASAATLIYMLGDVRIWNSNENDLFVIHNPWCENVGDANSMYMCGKSLEEIEVFFANVYATATGKDENKIREIMAEDRPMKEDEMLELNFATQIEINY